MKESLQLSVRYSDTYKAALLEIKEKIESFRDLESLYDMYMVEAEIKKAKIADNIFIIQNDYKKNLDRDSLYLNISDLKTIKACNTPVLNLLRYAFNDSELKLFFYISNDNTPIAFIKVPLSHIEENARHY